MRRNNLFNFNPRQYEEHLSPFGRQVLGILIKQWNADRDRNINNPPHHHSPFRHNYNTHRRVITFEETSVRIDHITCNRTNNALNDAENLDNDLNDDRPFEVPPDHCSREVASASTAGDPALRARTPPAFLALSDFTAPPSFPVPPVIPTPVINTSPAFKGLSYPKPVLTSADLVKTAVTTSTNEENFSHDDLVTSMNENNVINESRNVLNVPEDNMNGDGKFDNAMYKARSDTAKNVNWDDMFDTELFQDMETTLNEMVESVNIHHNNDNIFNIQYPDDRSSNTHLQSENTHKVTKNTDSKKPKRKNQSKVTDGIPNKVKKIKTDTKIKTNARPKSIRQKDKVIDWLNEVDPNNPLEESIEPLEANEQLMPSKTKGKTEIIIQKGPPEKPNKKVVQAQLANKDGIMKFGKPKKNIDKNEDNFDKYNNEAPKTEAVTGENKHKDNDKVKEKKLKSKFDKEAIKTEAVTSENKPKDNDKVKEKKSKSKFVVPIKSQIPVKDLTYEIHELDNTNAEKLKAKDQEIIATLLYSNGFCQLNNQHTDDACVPEAVMFYLDDCFYYLKEGTKETTTIVMQMLQNNTMICYDGKALLIYLTTKFELNFDTICSFNIIDVKIGGSLLEPDSPPETFSALQRLTGYEPEFTIATTCMKQKAAWYATLLCATATALRDKLELEDLWQVFVDIEMGILPIIADMEQRGVSVDTDKLKEMEKILMTKMKEVESQCVAAAGRSFQVCCNLSESGPVRDVAEVTRTIQINSTVQVRALLYDELKLDEKAGLKVRGTLTTGAKSTSETMLKSLVSVHPLPRLILEYRHLHKAHATFLQGIAQYVRGGVVRPVWVQTAAATGRIASSNPNLQAIPKVPFSLRLFPENNDERTEESLRFRSVYVSRAGHVMLAADWRHVECRVFARAAADTALQRALEAPDLFRRLAADWLKKPEEEISPADRERTKRIVYASLYGAGPRKLMDILEVDYAQALSIAASFDRTFPSLRSFGRRVAAQCLEAGGRVATLCGRARTLPHIMSSDAAQRSHAERQALNFIVQGSAADVCKLAMGDAVRGLRARGLRARLLLQIHDELVWEVHTQDLSQAAEVIRSAMEQCGSRAGLTSLPVALSVGHTWGELAPYPLTTNQSDWESQPESFEP